MPDWEAYGDDNTRIYHGSAIEVLNSIPDGTVDLIFADPPYNIGKTFGSFKDVWPSDEEYASWCHAWLEQCINKLSPTGSLYFMTSTQAMPLIDVWMRSKMTILSRIVWHYDSSGVQAKKFYGSMFEPILFSVKNPKNYTFNSSDIEVEARTGSVRKLMDYRKATPTPYKTTKIPGNAWYMARVRYRMPEYEEHPSQKPEALLERIIKASSNVGDMVLDPFAGTFTTGAVAKRLGRRTIGIELNEDYVKIGLRRLAIADTYKGQKLVSPQKNTERRNSNGVRHPVVSGPQQGLFDG